MNIDKVGEYSAETKESPKITNEKTEEILKMEDDPQFNQVLQEESLGWLKTQNKEYFNREFTGELDEQGYLIGKDGDSSTKPFQNIGGGKPMLEILERAKNRFVKEFSQLATKYPETALLAKKQNLSKNKEQLEQSIEKDTVEIKKAREKLGIASNDDPPSVKTAKERLSVVAGKLIKTEQGVKQEEKQGELTSSFLEREYGEEKESYVDKAKESPKKGVDEYIVDKPEDRNRELKREIGEEIEKANQAGRPLEKDQEEALRKKVLGGLSQESIKQKESESSVVDDVEQLGASELKNEDRESGRENGEQKSAGVALEKIRTHEFSGYTKDLVNTLRRREGDNLSSIVDPKAIGYLAHAIDDLENMFYNKKTTTEDLNRTILKVAAVIDAIGKDLPRTGMIRDNSESLRRLAYNIRNLGESSRNIMIQIGGVEDPNLKETVGRFGQLLNLTEEKWGYVNRKVGALENR